MKVGSIVISLIPLVTSLALQAKPVKATAMFFTNEVNWEQAVTAIESFQFTSTNIASADEVGLPPPSRRDLRTTVLTFQASNTGLSRGFQLTSTTSGQTWVFEDRGILETLSPGLIDPDLDNDDFQVELLPGSTLTGFAFDLVNNNVQLSPESISVFGVGDTLLGRTSLPLDNGSAFLGVIADVPITKILVDEDALGDDILIANFRFAQSVRSVPEYSSIASLLPVLTIVTLLRKKQNNN